MLYSVYFFFFAVHFAFPRPPNVKKACLFDPSTWDEKIFTETFSIINNRI
ncbi:hypothetical protein RchiOBHm_Chr5g0081961 [Rosa chinensis]|uniref:Uncharacterized protein n=1 Tax=Rosa chinensis TaxID=74649 RepID=A0A2P6QN75_ROSCH|nr:hypothetical protein RchiOBHm_Chr5g0081961 [Rosa chinensis]